MVLCKRPFYKIHNFILYFISLLLDSPSFWYLLDYSAHFRSLHFTSSFGLPYLRMFPTILAYVMFYWRTISDSRLFIVPILTWSIWNTVSVLWNLLVRCVATIHKSGPGQYPMLQEVVNLMSTFNMIIYVQKTYLGGPNVFLDFYMKNYWTSTYFGLSSHLALHLTERSPVVQSFKFVCSIRT